jgi:curved DNA-binding protein CbpA
MDVINPYELLGFDSKTPNIEMKELKKQYYMLSLICHPDKGGNSSDMIILKNCYEYVKEQIERKDEKSRDYEEVATEFKEFMKTQSQDPPPFSQVYEEAHIWLKEFNDKFNNLKMNNSRDGNLDNNLDNNDEELNDFSIDTSGYGHLMDKSENDSGFSFDDIEFMRVNRDKEVNEKPNVEFTTDIAIYTEPISFNGVDFGTMGNLKKTKVNDFTTRMGNNVLSDYKQAFSSPQPQQQETELNINISTNVMGRYEQLLEEREAMDKLLFEENNNKNNNKNKNVNINI